MPDNDLRRTMLDALSLRISRIQDRLGNQALIGMNDLELQQEWLAAIKKVDEIIEKVEERSRPHKK